MQICTQSTCFERQGVFLHHAVKEGETERGSVASVSFAQGISTTNSNLLLTSHFKRAQDFLAQLTACGISVLQPGMEPMPPAVEARCLKYWTTWEVPVQNVVCLLSFPVQDRCHEMSDLTKASCFM